MTGVITDILSQQAFDQLDQLNKKLTESIASFEKTAAAAKLLDQAVAGAKNITDYTTASEKLVSATKEMTDAGKQVETTYVKIKEQTTQATTAIKQEITTLQEQSSAYKNLFASGEAYSKQIAAYKLQLADLSSKQKELTGDLNRHLISQNNYIKKSAEIINQQNTIKTALSQASLEFKRQAKEAQDAETSMSRMSQELSRLKTAYQQLSGQERGSAGGIQLLGNIQELDGQIKALDADLGNFQRNVGNYSSATKGMDTQLKQITAQMEQMSAAGQQDSEAFKQLSVQQQQLGAVMQSTDGKIEGVTVELRQIKNAMIQMELAGLKGSEAYEQLAARAIELKEAMQTAGAAIETQTKVQMGAFQKFQNMAIRLVERISIYFGIYQAFFLLKQTIEDDNKAFEEMEDSVSKLNNILENIGRSDAIDRINTKVTILAQQFKFLNEADVRDVFVQLITYGKLTENQIDKLLPIIINFAAKARISVSQAASDIIRAFEGNSRALKEYSINLKGTSTESERYGIITAALQKRVEGAGAAFEKTAEGQMADYKAQLKEAEEQTGKSTIRMAIWWEGAKAKIARSITDLVDLVRVNFGGLDAKMQVMQGTVSDATTQEFANKSPEEVKAALDKSNDALKQQILLTKQANEEYKKALTTFNSLKNKYTVTGGALISVPGAFEAQQTLKSASKNLHDEMTFLAASRAKFGVLSQLYSAKLPSPAGNKILGAGGGDGITKTPDTTNLELSIQKRINDAVFQLEKDRLTAVAETEKGIAETEKNTLKERLDQFGSSFDQRAALLKDSLKTQTDATKNYYDIQVQIVKLEAVKETEDINIKLKKIAEIESKSASKRTKQEKDLLLTKKALLAEREVIEEKSNANSVKNYEEYYKSIEFIQKEGEAELLKISEENIQSKEGSALLANLEVKLAQYKELTAKFKSGKISNEEFSSGKNLIDDSSQKQAIEEDQKALLEKKSLHEQNGKDTIDIDKQIYDNKIKLLDLEIKKEEEVASKKLQLQQNIKDGLKQLGEEMINVAKVAVESQYENQKNAVQKQIDLLNKGKEAEIKAVESSTENEQQKANRIAIIQANAATETERLDRKKRDLSIKEAEFEKEAAILSVVIKTAEAVAQSELEASILASNPLTVALAPMALAQIPIEIAVGAAQAAAILAKPIPKYATGTESAPGGLALTDERGPELYIEPSGKTYLGNGKPTLRNVVKGTQIIPHDQLNQMILQAAVSDTLLLSGIKDNSMDKKLDEIKNVMMWQTGQLEKAYGKNKAPKIIFKNQEGWNSYIRKSVYE